MNDIVMTIQRPAERAAGISEVIYDFPLGDIDLEEARSDYREGIRQAAAALGEALTGDKCHVFFSDECGFCGAVNENGVCPRVNCLSNAPHDDDDGC